MTNSIQILRLLDAYQQVHEEASGHLKGCLWNLTKARHSKTAGRHCQEDLVASQVRPQVRPRAVLVSALSSSNRSRNEPPLQDETAEESDEKPSKDEDTIQPILFRVVDPTEEKMKQRSTAAAAAARGEDNNNNDAKTMPSEETSGLRQRKNVHKTTESPTAAWTIIQEEEGAAAEANDSDDEETRLQKVDPLELFGGGLNPRTLRVAQQEAKKALETYVRAANLKRVIEFELNQQSL